MGFAGDSRALDEYISLCQKQLIKTLADVKVSVEVAVFFSFSPTLSTKINAHMSRAKAFMISYIFVTHFHEFRTYVDLVPGRFMHIFYMFQVLNIF